mmetsp:Transcript_15216/g.34064  ORF Transcript_15216/g.34064 Transcript_15216/m.34064 type:complete len:329 (-) Transcript_15216:2300-3286(-)
MTTLRKHNAVIDDDMSSQHRHSPQPPGTSRISPVPSFSFEDRSEDKRRSRGSLTNDYYNNGSSFIARPPKDRASLEKLDKRRELTESAEKLVIALVGLPGRGKSFIGRKLQIYLQWRGARSKVFNVGKYRREVVANVERKDSGSSASGLCSANFFDSQNADAKRIREEVAKLAMKDMEKWLENSQEQNHGWGSVAILDATNSTRARRQLILDFCHDRADKFGVVFVESVCDDQNLLDENFKKKIEVSPDYKVLQLLVCIKYIEAQQKYQRANIFSFCRTCLLMMLLSIFECVYKNTKNSMKQWTTMKYLTSRFLISLLKFLQIIFMED